MTKTTTATILQALLIPVAALAALLVGATADAPQGGWVGTDTALAQKPHNVPAWTDALAEDFPTCEAFREGVLVSHVVIVDQQGDAHRVTVEAAVERATDDATTNDMWVVGLCHATRTA